MTLYDEVRKRVQRQMDEALELWLTVPDYSIEKASRNAKRKNRLADEKLPLLAYAKLVEHISPEDLKEKYDQMNEEYFAKLAGDEIDRGYEVLRVVRDLINMVADEETLAAFEAYRVRVFPADLVYDLEFYKKALKSATENKDKSVLLRVVTGSNSLIKGEKVC